MTRSLPPPAWTASPGPEDDVVVATRCRIARCVEGIPFPWRASEADLLACSRWVRDALERLGGPLGRGVFLEAAGMSADCLDRLLQARWVSPAWLEERAHRLLFISDDGVESLMVHEEDHLRLQAMLPGLQAGSALERVRASADGIGSHLPYARDPAIGYLTASIANAGGGLRASALVHLPALGRTGRLGPALAAARELGGAVRGLFGEGTEGTGDLYQVSSTCARLGERDAAARAEAAARHLARAERIARDGLFGGAAGRARLASEAQSAARSLLEGDPRLDEVMGAVSLLRLAACLGVVPVPLPETAAWIAVAGPAVLAAGSRADALFRRGRHAAALRARVRSALAGMEL